MERSVCVRVCVRGSVCVCTCMLRWGRLRVNKRRIEVIGRPNRE